MNVSESYHEATLSWKRGRSKFLNLNREKKFLKHADKFNGI